MSGLSAGDMPSMTADSIAVNLAALAAPSTALTTAPVAFSPCSFLMDGAILGL